MDTHEAAGSKKWLLMVAKPNWILYGSAFPEMCTRRISKAGAFAKAEFAVLTFCPGEGDTEVENMTHVIMMSSC